MTKKVSKTEIVEGGEEHDSIRGEVHDSKSVTVSMDAEEDPQMVTNLKDLNNLLVKQTMELRQQVEGLNIVKEKLELDISRAEERARALMAERDLYVQKHNDSKEDNGASQLMFDVERMLNSSVISSAISQRNVENEKWQRRLEKRVQKEQEKHQALADAWKMEKEALENEIRNRETRISELVRIQESIQNRHHSEKVELENTISSQETNVTRLIELNKTMKESLEKERDGLQTIVSTLEHKISGETKSNEENKKKIHLQDLHIIELKGEVENLMSKITDLIKEHEDLESTYDKTRIELQQSEEGRKRELHEKRNLHEMISKLKLEMTEKETLLSSLKDGIDDLEKREAKRKKKIQLQDLHIQELKGEVENLKSKITELIKEHEDLESTYNKTRIELQQSEEGHRRELHEKQNLHEMISKLKLEMTEKETLLSSLKEGIDDLEKREAKWKKKYDNAAASGERVLSMLRKTTQMIASYEGGSFVVDSIENGIYDDNADTQKYKEELEAICGSFRKMADKIHEMVQKIDKMTVELGEQEKKASMNVWHNIASSLTGAGVVFALAFITKLRW